MFKIHNKSPYDLKGVETMFSKFFPYVQKRLGFDKPVSVNLVSDEANASDPLGKTAFYDPQNMAITIFVDNRHPKDMLRSLSHELVHHKQNCDGRFNDVGQVGEDYAQTNQHLRDMEAEAYLLGNGFLVRDYTDGLKFNNQMRESIKMNEEAIRKMTRIILEKLDEGWKEGPFPPPSEEEAEELRGQSDWPPIVDSDPTGLGSTGPEGPTAPVDAPPGEFDFSLDAGRPYKRDDEDEEVVVMKEDGETPCGCAVDAHPGQPHDQYIASEASGRIQEECDLKRDEDEPATAEKEEEPIEEGEEKPDNDGDGVPPWADKDDDDKEVQEESNDIIARQKSLKEHASGGKQKALYEELVKKWCK